MSEYVSANRPYPRWPPTTKAEDKEKDNRPDGGGGRLLSRLRKKLSFPDRDGLKKAQKTDQLSHLTALPTAVPHIPFSQEGTDARKHETEAYSRHPIANTSMHLDDNHIPPTDAGVLGRLLHRAKNMTGRKHARRPEDAMSEAYPRPRQLPAWLPAQNLELPLSEIYLSSGDSPHENPAPSAQAKPDVPSATRRVENTGKSQHPPAPQHATLPAEIPAQKHAAIKKKPSLQERLRPKSRGSQSLVSETVEECNARYSYILRRPASAVFTTPLPSPRSRSRSAYISSANLGPYISPSPPLSELSPAVFPAAAGVDVLHLIKEKRLSLLTISAAASAKKGLSDPMQTFAEHAPLAAAAPAPSGPEPITPQTPFDVPWNHAPPSLPSRQTSPGKRHSYKLTPDPWDSSQKAVQAPIASVAASEISLISITRTPDKKAETAASAPQLAPTPTSTSSEPHNPATTSNPLRIITSFGTEAEGLPTRSPAQTRKPTDFEIFLARAEAREREDQEMREMAWRCLAARAATAGMPPGHIKRRPQTQYGPVPAPNLGKRRSGWFKVHNHRYSWAPAPPAGGHSGLLSD